MWHLCTSLTSNLLYTLTLGHEGTGEEDSNRWRPLFPLTVVSFVDDPSSLGPERLLGTSRPGPRLVLRSVRKSRLPKNSEGLVTTGTLRRRLVHTGCIQWVRDTPTPGSSKTRLQRSSRPLDSDESIKS